MITTAQYFFNPSIKESKPHSTADEENAQLLLDRVNAMLSDLGWDYPVDPDTGCSISGSKGGSGDGGYRMSTTTTGKSGSKHKTAHAVDVYDPKNELDDLLTDELLTSCGLYREHPDDTPGWTHLQDVPPGSGRHTFKP